MKGRIRGFFAFWYDFVVGDDWRVAASVAVALAATFAVGKLSSMPVWWILPAAVVILLPMSLIREVRKHS